MRKADGNNDPIKVVFDKLGETLDFEKKALRKMNVDGLLRNEYVREGRACSANISFFAWLAVLLIWRDALHSLRVQIFFLTNVIIITFVMGHKARVVWQMRKKVRQGKRR